MKTGNLFGSLSKQTLILLSGLAAAVLFAVVSLMVIAGEIGKRDKAILERDEAIAQLAAEWEQLGNAVTGLVIIKPVVSGQEIRPDNWSEYMQEAAYPEKLNLNVATAADLTAVKYMRCSLKEGTVVTSDDLLESRLDDSLRHRDILLDEYPVEMIPGKYVDIRIRFPFGQDFIALPHRCVDEIRGGTIRIKMTEQDIFTYNSMLTDKVLYDAQLYAVEYVDAGVQQAADAFYPLNYNMQEILAKNPNVIETVKREMALTRELLEAEMPDTAPKDAEALKAELLTVQGELASLRDTNTVSVNAQQALFYQRWLKQQAGETGDDGSTIIDDDSSIPIENQGPVRY